MNGIKKYIKKTFKSIKNAPAIKGHLDFIAVIISIILSALLLLQTVKNLHGSDTKLPVPTPAQEIITTTPAETKTASPQTKATLPAAICKKGLAPISIDSPSEGDIVSANPVCITINYEQGDFCSAVWSYRVNNGNWSDYGNDSPCLYNVPSGKIIFDLRVKSLVTSETKTLERGFTYQNPSSTASAQLQ